MESAKREEPVLRHVEKDVLIPKLMREKAKERCSEKVHAFNECCKDSGFLMVLKCREQNTALKECLTVYYKDPAFYEECKQEYLKEKQEFIRTGVPTKNRQQKLPTIQENYAFRLRLCASIERLEVTSVQEVPRSRGQKIYKTPAFYIL
ncbi:hypothetical protein AOXY_G3594 [Acipenser oxyrinchus oxyrinchus]|uniref:COX assembly mitochondrial protein n=1 Tax=Acipenser oxyrinchus oxyrinchus TaxID=40147 RepID=A0AAD8GFH4_ACIOX|nr:hypothetical protein AOXY_G3594 [Acipenser oxyrinchus oxyrinchus]